jgi:hypothetical protein
MTMCDYPTGKSIRGAGGLPVKPSPQKYSDFQNNQISLHPLLSRPTEGRFAIVTDAGRDAVDADGALTNAPEVDGEVVWS